MKNFPVAFPRIQSLCDRDSFQIFPSEKSSGVLTGFGEIDGRTVGIFAQEPTLFAGAMGLQESRLVCGLMDEALKRKAPIVGILHSSGAKIQEGVDSLAGYAEIFKRNVQCSGVIPQISLVMGTCAGGAVYSPALTDLIIIVEEKGEMFITGPDVIRQTTGETTDRENLGGAEVHLTKSGVAHLVTDEKNAANQIKQILSFLPSHCDQNPPIIRSEDKAERESPELNHLAKEDRRKAYDVRRVIETIVDRGSFLEIQPRFAENIVIGWGRLDGQAAGFVANNSAALAGALDNHASMKAARFVRLCDCFNIPVITLVDVPGYWPGIEQEHSGIIRHGAKLLHAYAEAEVPCITVILRKAYGGAYCVMGSKQCGAIINLAWPCAEIAVMGPGGAVEVLFKREIASSGDPDKYRQKKTEEYLRKYANPELALKQNYIEKIIEPSRTRIELIQALKQVLPKYRPHFKHRNIPL